MPSDDNGRPPRPNEFPNPDDGGPGTPTSFQASEMTSGGGQMPSDDNGGPPRPNEFQALGSSRRAFSSFRLQVGAFGSSAFGGRDLAKTSATLAAAPARQMLLL
jgi:hypothetical protein